MNSKFKTVIGRTIVVFFTIAGILSFASLHSLTLANAWLIGLGSLAVAAAPGIVFANKDKYVLTFRRPALRMVAWIGVLTVVADGAFYGFNYIGADKSRSEEIEAVVEKKYYKERQQTKRISRRVYTSNGTYHVPYADLRLSDGHLITLQLHGKEALDTHKGDRFRVTVAPGALGAKVVFRGSIVNRTKQNNHKKYKRRNYEKIRL